MPANLCPHHRYRPFLPCNFHARICCGDSLGTGTAGQFVPQEGAHPAIGQVGTPERVEEDRVEVVVGPAEKSLAAMVDDPAHGITEESTYDFAFIDAFIVNNVTYMKE